MLNKNLQLIATINYRNHYFYIYHYPEFVVFEWLVVVNSIVGGSAGIHWLSSYGQAEIWGKRCIDAICSGKISQFLLKSRKAGEVPEVE